MQYRRLGRSGYAKLCVWGGIVLGAVGCDGSATSGRVSDGGARDSGVRGDARNGGNPGTDMPRAEPVISELLTRLPLTGKVTLLGGEGFAGCTHQDPAPGDRWCAIARTAETNRTELWVINLTAAVAGAPIDCSGMDPNCLLLTQNLWTGTPSVGPSHPTAHAFDGDTLIFHADALSTATDLYRGPIFAWRPGWAEARRISSPNGVLCSGHARGQVATCLDNIELDETKPLEFDLLAGPLPEAPNQQLPRMDRIHALRSNDISKWRAAFSRDGSQFCYSTGRTPNDAENLWCFNTGEMPANAVPAGVRTSPPLLTDASRWQFARDSQKLYYLRGFNYSSDGNANGSLVMVDYPSAANPVEISKTSGAFFLLSDGTDVDKGLGVYTDIVEAAGTLRFMRDRSMPTNTVLIAEGVSDARVSPDLRYTFFSSDISEDTGLSDAFIARNNEAKVDVAAPICALQTKQLTALLGTPFLARAGLVFWFEVDPKTFVGKGMVANPADCSRKQQFATDLDSWLIVNDDGIVFSDEAVLVKDGVETDIVSFRYARVAGGNTWPAGGAVKVQGQVKPNFSLAIPKYNVAVVQIQEGYPSDGVYFARLPFGTPPDADGGTDAADAGASVDAEALLQ